MQKTTAPLRAGLIIWMCLFCLFTSLPAYAIWPFGNGGLDYAIRFEGANDEMRGWFTSLALDKKEAVRPPRTQEELDAEANTLAAKTKKALAAKGYVEAIVEPLVNHAAKPPVISLSIEQGTRYSLAALDFRWPGKPLKPLDPAMLLSKKGEPLDFTSIEKDAATLRDAIAKDACLLSLSVTPKLQLDSTAHNAKLIFTIEHGPSARFGNPVIHGTQRVKSKVILRSVAWKQGECFDQAKIDTTRTRLIESQLFASVDISPAPTVDANGEVAIPVTVKERVARTIGAGVQYSTDKGAGVSGSWEHRNLLGGAEDVKTALTLAQKEQNLTGTFRIPDFMRPRQTLVLSSSLKHEDIDAYEAMTFEGSAGVERPLARHLKGGLGVGYTLSQTRDITTGTNNYALLSFPSFLEYDRRDNVLNPRHGMLARLSATPYTETVGDGGQFFKLLGTWQNYLSDDDILLKPTFASRLSLGAIYGSRGDSIPADIRYYAGGGGSVRGYKYQSLSPYFNGEPGGGSSLAEASGELRLRFTETLGGVLFVDAGNAYSTSSPDFSQKLYLGGGTGVRYYSAIGPLRLDIAFPLNGKDIGAKGYQLYVSLGQAF